MNAAHPEPVIVPHQLIERYLEIFVPEVEGLLSLMQETTPGDGISFKLREYLGSLNIRNWASLYQDQANQIKVPLLICMTPDEINAINREVSAMTPEHQSKWVQDQLEAGLEKLDVLDEEIDKLEAAAASEAILDEDEVSVPGGSDRPCRGIELAGVIVDIPQEAASGYIAHAINQATPVPGSDGLKRTQLCTKAVREAAIRRVGMIGKSSAKAVC